MKIFYESSLKKDELIPGRVYKTIPYKAKLKLKKENNDGEYEIVYNDTAITYTMVDEIECNETANLLIRTREGQFTYIVRPSVKPLSIRFAQAYEQFQYEYENSQELYIDRIKNGVLKLYAVDQSLKIDDWASVYDQLENSYYAIKAICEKPKSHLKSINEVRPIETVKRVGYESIPYLAAHSEDWLARTASGLKPARLFSRAEDDDFQIYENRVVKTLIDQIVNFLRKTEKQAKDQRDQLKSILTNGDMNGNADSFGFDVTFAKAISELMQNAGVDDSRMAKSFKKIDRLQNKAHILLKKYRALRKTRLYRYLKYTKKVQNPLNETNILLMDKHYNVVFNLWKVMRTTNEKKDVTEEYSAAFDDVCDDYLQFCSTLVGYAAHIMGFEQIDEFNFQRAVDDIGISIEKLEECMIRVTVRDSAYRFVEIESVKGLDIDSIEYVNGFYNEGNKLYWPNDISDAEIDEFCSHIKNKTSKKQSKEEKKLFTLVKQKILEANRAYDEPVKVTFIISPVAVEVEPDTRISLKRDLYDLGEKILNKYDPDFAIIALPLCNEDEQKLVDYARNYSQKIMALPLTMFDINSFRRIQNILYRCILKMDKGKCPFCGAEMIQSDNQLVCNDCGWINNRIQWTLTKTICPHSDCRRAFYYINRDISSENLHKMKNVKKDSFFQWDSLYQYKDIVDMTIDGDRLRPVCPYCNR